nr:amidase family protein [Bacillus subtilis]
MVAFASSLDQIGPITRTVEDNAFLLQAILRRQNGLHECKCGCA